MAKEIKLGRTYTDTVHGIKGLATARIEYLTQCARTCLTFVKGGEVKEHWTDDRMLELVKKGRRVKAPDAAAPSERPGGPGAMPPSLQLPR
jgi:hypothetical protein